MKLKLSKLNIAVVSAITLSPFGVSAESNDQVQAMETMVVTASRSQQLLNDVPRSVTVIDQAQLQSQLNQSRSINDVLSTLVPGMGTSVHGNLSSKGQNQIRGRRVLLLIDGVAQNNSFLDFGQELSAIDPQNVERIEVIRGGSAVYGLGAQGGIINVITKMPEEGAVEYRTKVGTSFQEFGSDAFTWNVYQEATGGDKKDQWRLGLGYEQRGGSYDANGDRLPSVNNEDDMDNLNVNGVWNRNIDEDRSLTLTVGVRNITDNEGWCAANGDAANGKPAEAVHCGPGYNNGVAGKDGAKPNDVTRTFANYQARYQDLGFSLGMLDVTGYWMTQDTETFTLAMKDKNPNSPTFGQTLYGHNETDFDRFGVKANISSQIDWAFVTWGMDVEQQSFKQPNSVGFYNNTPDVEQFAIAPFAQFITDVSDNTVLSYGIRYEYVRLSVDDFTVGNTHNNAGDQVQGGDPYFDEFLFNIGVTHDLTDNHQLFASFAQGMSTNEALRDIRSGNSSTVEGAIKPITTDNYEVGVRGFLGEADYSLAAFYSESDLGSTLNVNEAGDALESTRAPEKVWGAEATLGYSILANLRTDSTISWQEGERKLNEDSGWEPLDGTRIAPLKVTSVISYDAYEFGRYNMTLVYSGNRDKEDEITSGAKYAVDSYFVANAGVDYDLPFGTLSFAVENLFNEDYMTAYAQSERNNSRYYNAPGRRFHLNYEVKY
ncbi:MULTISPECIES: TonB-dependent receptor [Vibrio]|uniref:TonB-dependent receptor n=1 Tax=Vibrio TaxID=662 RepID=UPI0025573417|nr:MULTISPECIES: TonB-dependent receptor [unclassified Vibrio]EJL6784852.1 TonB-dependent receptor [Vibrio alginolyticus]ELB2922945.1 TonB-dependent receptor [Vibrio alginolyticus]MDK9729132.1 TonB-dependent receptor [Vibrio sp. D415a]MDK9745343.1 TonB-dependent receptor [Vibrio sp. D409a]MDK9765520.1 TonB-dependent receptor [Vibrio sp. D417a]